jgi:hypothetical protein
MPLLIILLVGVAVFALIEAGFIPSPVARVHLVVKNGKTDIVRGMLASRSRELVSDIIKNSDVATGFITVSGSSKVRFSRSIPGRIRQQLTNVVLL